jgi:hypothetical protein
VHRIAGWLLGGIGLLLLWAVVSRVRTYGRLLSDAHFQWLAIRVPDLKSAALARLIAAEADAIADLSDPRVLSTKPGLVVVYTVRQREAEFIHHCSVSFPGQHVAQGSVELFLHFVVRLLGLPLPELRFERGASGVQHAECVLSTEAHAALAAQAPREWSAAELLALRSEAMDARRVSSPS